MRAVSGGNVAQPTSLLADFTDAVRIEVANAADALVDLSDFAVSLEYDSSADAIVDGATVVFRRLEGVNSLAPLMTASPPVALGRRIVVSINPGSGTYTEVFRGKIDDVDWPERFGDVTVQCRDQAGVVADTWIETASEYSTEAGVALETVMQAVANANLAATPTLYFPVPTGAVVQHLPGDPPYGPSEQSTLDAERTLAEAIGWTIRWRHFGASASDWRWTVFLPSRTKTVADHTFGTSDYWDVTTMRQAVEDIRNAVEVLYVEEGVQKSIGVLIDSASIAKYGRRYMKITEGSDSPVNNLTLATALGNAALSDLKEPDALLEITGRYFWPGEIGVDLYTFTANGKHFSTDQTLAAMRFSHRIAVGERPTTKILCRGKPSGGVLMWRRRLAIGSTLPLQPEMRVSNFREIRRTETTVTFGWDVAGSVTELWLYLSTPAQPVATDPWAVLTGVPSARLTAGTDEYTVAIPNAGLVTYGRLVPIDADVARGQSWDFTVQGAAVSLIQRATIVTTTATQIVVRVAVANPITGTDITISYAAGALVVTPASGQVIAAGSVTTDLATTGTVDFTITRPAFSAGTGRATFTASSTDRVSDTDAVDVPALERDTVELLTRAKVQSSSATQVVFRVAVADYVSGGSGDVTLTYSAVGCTINTPASPQTILAANVTADIDTTGSVDVTIDRAIFGAGMGRVTFTATRTGRVPSTDSGDVPSKDRDTQPVAVRVLRVSESATQLVVRVEAITPNAGATCTVAYNNGGLTVSPASGGTFTSTTDFATTAHIDYTITRPLQGTDPRRVAFTVSATGFVDGADGVDVVPQGDRFRTKLQMSGNQTLTNNTNTILLFDTEEFDVGGLHSTSSNTGRVTIPTGGDVGVWQLIGLVTFVGNATGMRRVFLEKNGASALTWDEENGQSGVTNVLHINETVVAAVGDYFHLVALQTSGGDMDVVSGLTILQAVHLF